MTSRHKGFEPVIGKNPRILILGTFPGLASRIAGEYYGNPRNAFWRIMFSVLGQSFNHKTYPEKLRLLTDNGIALWDVVRECETAGSADSEICRPVFIDLNAFLREHSTIRAVFFNGGNAAKYAKKLGPLPVPSFILPSSSPANARLKFEEKLLVWRNALDGYLKVD